MYSRLKRKINVASLGLLDGAELDVSLDDYYRPSHNDEGILLVMKERQRHLAITDYHEMSKGLTSWVLWGVVVQGLSLRAELLGMKVDCDGLVRVFAEVEDGHTVAFVLRCFVIE